MLLTGGRIQHIGKSLNEATSIVEHANTAGAIPVVVLVLAFCAAAQQPLFSPPVGSPFAVEGQLSDLILADLDGNRSLDIVATSARGLNILLGDGRGGFRIAPGSPVPAGPAPHLLAAGDLNGDGKTDLAATSHDSNDVYVLSGSGDGRFQPAPGSPFAAFANSKPHNHGLALVDVNGDGRLDITSGHQEAGRIAVLLNLGASRFVHAPSSPFAVGRTPYPHAFADLNKDDKPDLVVPDVIGGVLSIWLGDGRGGFAPAPGSPIRTLPRPFFARLDDFNADGNIDLIASHDDISSLTILLGDGRGSFRPAPTSPADAGRQVSKIASGDFNRDSHRDLIIAGGGLTLMLGNGKGGFSVSAESNALRSYTGGWRVAVGDVNGDGKLDLVAPSPGEDGIAVLLAR